MTFRTLALTSVIALGIASSANATMLPAPVSGAQNAVVKVADGCGRGEWRGPRGRCHPMYNGRACPRGYHLGPERKRCHPND